MKRDHYQFAMVAMAIVTIGVPVLIIAGMESSAIILALIFGGLALAANDSARR